MAYNGSGVFSRSFTWATDKTNAVPVTASRMDTEDDGFATGLSNAICKDGQTVTTARIPFALGVSAMAGAVNSVSYGQINDIDTGFYFPAAGQWAAACDGTQVLSVISSLVAVQVPLAVTQTSAFTGEITASATATFTSIAKFTSTSHLLLASGTTGQRPSNAAGLFRYNSTLSAPEFSTGAAWKTLRNEAPTAQVLTSGTAATYTTPSGATWLKVRVIGGGGGGGGGGTNALSGGDGGVGGNTSFNSIVATRGLGGTGGGAQFGIPGAGGASGAGSATLRIAGGGGNFGVGIASNAGLGGAGGASALGGAGCPTLLAGAAGSANSGAGGAGGSSSTASSLGGGGGGAGEYYELIILAPSATYTYTIGAGGLAGAAGNGATGGAGAAGIIIVEEYYS